MPVVWRATQLAAVRVVQGHADARVGDDAVLGEDAHVLADVDADVIARVRAQRVARIEVDDTAVHVRVVFLHRGVHVRLVLHIDAVD